MRGEERFCTNCRAPLPARAAWCEKCGTDAGDVFDGRRPRQKNSPARAWSIVFVLAIAAAVAVFLYRDDVPIPKFLRSAPKFDTGPVTVVSHRPGGTKRAPGSKLSQPEAIRTLRAYLVAREDQPIKSECLAAAARGIEHGAYIIDAVDSCHHTSLGRWRVDGQTVEVQK